MRILQHLPTPLRGTILAATVLSGVAFAQTGLTTIQDTLFKADGTRFTGTLTIQWSTFDATNVGTIVQQSKSVDVANGLLQVQLVPNAAAAAPANVYTVHYQSDANQQFTESWTVPVSSQSLTVADVRVGMLATSGSTGTAAGNSTPIVESAVVGLVSDLAERPIKGPGFGTGSVAVINQNGQIEASVGDPGECVLVDGTTAPCGGPQSQFFDAETPGGIVDGTNNTFTLLNAPSGSSLALYRNGLYMSANFDYTLNGSALTFVTGGVPQPGDTLIANYRIDPSAGNVVALNTGSGTGSGTGSIMAQVICSANGLSTSSTSWTTLGACGLPAAALHPGDRIEVRFNFTHTGTASGYGLKINWGSTTILAREAGAQDAAVAGESEAGIATTGAQITVQSWGTILSFLPAIIGAPVQSSVNIALQAQMPDATEDTVALTSYTVLRYPAN